MQRVLNDLFRRQSQPLRDRDVRELRRLQHFQQHHILVARVLDVMTGCHGNVPNVARSIVKGLRAGWGLVDGDARGAREKEVPLVAVGVPVQLTHCTWVDCDESGADVRRGREGGWINNLQRAGAGDGEWFLLRPMIRVLSIGLTCQSGWTCGVLLCDIGRGSITRENIPDL